MDPAATGVNEPTQSAVCYDDEREEILTELEREGERENARAREGNPKYHSQLGGREQPQHLDARTASAHTQHTTAPFLGKARAGSASQASALIAEPEPRQEPQPFSAPFSSLSFLHSSPQDGRIFAPGWTRLLFPAPSFGCSPAHCFQRDPASAGLSSPTAVPHMSCHGRDFSSPMITPLRGVETMGLAFYLYFYFYLFSSFRQSLRMFC